MSEAERVAAEVEAEVGHFYETKCMECGFRASVKYFLWVKSYNCHACGQPNDLFPGYMIASNARHPAFVWYCPTCDQLAEVPERPSAKDPAHCPHCDTSFPFIQKLVGDSTSAAIAENQIDIRPGIRRRHRLFAIEYHCSHCRADHKGRYFKVPSDEDLEKYARAAKSLKNSSQSLIPDDEIPPG